MNYKEAMEFIDSMPVFTPAAVVNGTAAFDLVAMGNLLKELGNPQKKLKFVHIAGTNGKGSTAAFTASILAASGYTTGLFTSPHIERFSERVRVLVKNDKKSAEAESDALLSSQKNGVLVNNEKKVEAHVIKDKKEKGSSSAEAQKIDYVSITTDNLKTIEATEEELAEEITAAYEASERMKAKGLRAPSEFELMTAVGFLHFVKKNCDIVVLEVGLGGRLDATNIIDTPELAIITTISYDHMEILGETLPAIASEKAGIIKENSIVLTYPADEEVNEVFRKKCTDTYSLHFIAPKIDQNRVDRSIEGQEFEIPEFKDEQGVIKLDFDFGKLKTVMLGTYQVNNAATAAYAAALLKKFRGYDKITKETIAEGIASTRWPARFEILRKNPYFIIDGGHNLEGARVLKESFDKYFPGKKITFVTGVLADKQYTHMLSQLLPIAKRFYTIAPPSPRALSAEDLAKYINVRSHEPIAEPYGEKYEEAVKAAIGNAEEGDVICAQGSLYFVGIVREMLTH